MVQLSLKITNSLELFQEQERTFCSDIAANEK
jgi:hypothetical protein